MDKNPETKLIQTVNSQAGDDLSMAGKPVLVQNQLGIFYGTLKKADTRKGTALLSNGYAIDPRKHLTFTQYLRFLCSEDNGNTLNAAIVRKTAQENTITDYATEGIAKYHEDTFSDVSVYHSALGGITPSVDLLSLTGIYVIVPVTDNDSANIMWEEIIGWSDKYDAKNDEFDITVAETFICIEDVATGTDGNSIHDKDDAMIREVKFSSAVLRPLIVKEEA